MKSLVRLLLIAGLLLAACKPPVPSEIIQPDDMEDLLYDYYVAQNITGDSRDGNDYRTKFNYGLVFQKYGVTEAEFDSSLVYYYNHIEDLYKIYERVQVRLSKEALELGASTGEVERYMKHSLSGDTMDIWTGPRHHLLFPQPPYNIYQFALKADTACHANDSYMLTFGSSFLVQSGSRNATALISVVYENDSVVTQSISVPLSGQAQVNIPECHLRAKAFKGYMYMPKRQGADNSTDMCLYLADHIQLMRFHHPEKSEQTDAAQKDSASVNTEPKLELPTPKPELKSPRPDHDTIPITKK
ncbi:MAG: DUF4296 domain-containing protein [Prevotella sp.]|nr:DUF4296 domain-containing protein [Prevotella sp.]